MPYERVSAAALSLAGALALALPAPIAAQEPFFVGLCSGGVIPLPAGQDGDKQNDTKNCRLACHAGDSRKRLPRSLP